MSGVMTKQATLTVTDRCDRCGAQALVMVLVPLTGEPDVIVDGDDLELNAWPLTFCGHHFRKAEPGMPPDAVIYADDRDTLS